MTGFSMVRDGTTRLAGARQGIAAASRWAFRCLISLLGIAVAGEAFAGTPIWTGGGSGTNANWSNTANWTGGTIPDGNDNLQFSGTVGLNSVNNLSAAGSSNNGIEFLASAGAFTLSGSTVTLDAPTFTLQNSSSNRLQTINFASLAMAAAGIYNANTGNFLIQSPITGGFGATFNSTSGTNGTTLTGSNSYTGLTTVSSGFLRIENANALGTTAGATTVSSGAALQLANNITIAAGEGLTLSGTGIANTGALRNVSGTNNYGGIVTLGAVATIGADASSQLNLTNNVTGNFTKTFGAIGDIVASGTVIGSGGVTKTGAGLLTFSATNTFTGTLAINAGTLRATTSGSALGQGTLTLGGGNLELANNTGLTFGRNTTVSTSGTIFSERLTAGAGVTHTLGTLSIGAQTLTAATDASVTSGTAGLTFGAVTATGAATFISGRTASANSLLTLGAITATNLGITVGGDGDTRITGIVGLGTGSLTKSGSGTLTMSAVNTYSGSTRILDGMLSISATNNLGAATTPVTLGDTSTVGKLAYTGTSVNFTRGFNVGAGGGQLHVTQSGSTFTIATGSIAGTGLFTVGGAGNVTVSSTIQGISGLTMAGSGTLTLSGANTYGGTTTVNSGVLRLGASNVLSSSNAISVTSGTFDIQTFSDTVGGFSISGGSFIGSGTITSTSGVYSLLGGTVSANLGSGTIATFGNTTLSATTAATSLAVDSGTLTLSTANILAAAPAVSGSAGATLSLGGSQTVGTLGGAADVALGANTLTTGSGNGSSSHSGAIRGNGNLRKIGSGTIALAGNSSFSGTAAIEAGAISVNSVASGSTNQPLGTGNTVNLGAAGSSSGRLVYTGNAGTLSKNVNALGNGTDTIQNAGSGLLTLSGTLTKNGTILRLQGGSQGITVTGQITGTSQNSDLAVQNGLTTLSTTNSYVGPTFINSSGTLALGISNAIPSNSAVTIGGTFADGNGGAGTLHMGTFTNAVGSLAFSGSGGTVKMAPTASATSAVVLSATGAVNLAGTTTLDLTGMATGAGRYRLIAGSSLTDTFDTVTGLDSNYVLRYGTLTTGQLDAQRKANQATTFTMTTGTVTRALVNTNVTVSGTVTNSSPVDSTPLTLGLASTGLSGSGFTTGSVAPGVSAAVSGTLAAGSIAGTQNWTITNTDANAITTTSTATGSLQVVNQRTFTTSTSTLALGFIHQGGSFGSPTVVVTSTGLNAVTADATLGSFGSGPSGFSLTTADSTAFNGGAASQTATYTLAGPTSTLGAISGTFSSAVTAELGSISNVAVAVTGNVYSGQSTWATNGGGNWGTFASGFGTNWGANQGSPGLDTNFANTDTATFGSALTGGTAAINTNGATISLQGLTFNNAAGSYELYQTGGSGPLTLLAAGTNAAGVTVLAGSHAIHADVTLGSNTVVDVASGAAFTFHNAVSGSAAYGLTKTGLGTLFFDGEGLYAGNTDIAQGVVSLLSGVNPLGTGTVTVRSGATLDFNFRPISNVLNVLSGGILLNTGSGQVTDVSSSTIFTGTTNGTVNVTSGGVATFESTVGALVTVNSGGSADFASQSSGKPSVNVLSGGVTTVAGTAAGSYTVAGTGTFSGPLTGAINVSSGGVVNFNGSNSGTATFNVASGGLANVGSSASIGGQLHVSGSAVIAGSVASNADVIVQSGGSVKLIGGASFAQTNLTNAGMFIVDRNDALSLDTSISGAGGLQKTGTGALTLTGANTFTGPTSLDGGSLLVNGSLASDVVAAAGTTLGGSGSIVGELSGVGLVSPGNSPGILTAGSFDPSGGLDAAFEFTALAPVYGDSGAGALNDVLRLTDGSPFGGAAFSASNVIDVYFNFTPTYQQTYQGGFFTTLPSADLLEAVKNATFAGWVKTNVQESYSRVFNGNIYNPIFYTPGLTKIKVSTQDVTANFAGGPVTGSVTEFVVVPEPGSLALTGVGIALLAWRYRSRRSR
jgi:fibronectin-binding autotransporter adhesin